jgi:Zn-dependent M28 family amino/carboxypeptidase
MRSRGTISAVAVLGLLWASENSSAQNGAPGFAKIQSNALFRSPAYTWLEELSDTIGGRLTGSPEAEKAAQWAVRKMEHAGLQKVHLESWSMSRGWRRGTARAEITSPVHLPLNVVSYGWTGSTPETESELVVVNRDALTDEIKSAAAWKGKILFVAPRGPLPADSAKVFSQMAGFVTAAAGAGAAAIICRDTRPGIMLTHTGPVSFSTEAFYSIPVVDIAAEQQKLIDRLLIGHKSVRAKIAVANTFSPGPIASSNVVGEIPGVEHPEQTVILGAHLDSWDLGSGSVDDGYGVAAVLGAAEAIVSSGFKPRRTIRVVLFTGEEQGLLGSRAWLRDHAADIPNVVCALVLDWGQGPITEIPLAGHKELEGDFAGLTEILAGVQPVKLNTGYLAFTDAYSFTLAGIPGLGFLQDSHDYTLIGHSAADMFDKVEAETLVRNIAVVALTAFWIADRPERVGVVWTADETARHLEADGQRTLLEMFSLWPGRRN